MTESHTPTERPTTALVRVFVSVFVFTSARCVHHQPPTTPETTPVRRILSARHRQQRAVQAPYTNTFAIPDHPVESARCWCTIYRIQRVSLRGRRTAVVVIINSRVIVRASARARLRCARPCEIPVFVINLPYRIARLRNARAGSAAQVRDMRFGRRCA